MQVNTPCKDHGKTTSLRPEGYALVPSRQRLNESQVAYIRLMYSSVRGDPYSAKQLGRRFGVDSKVIYNVLKGNYNAAK